MRLGAKPKEAAGVTPEYGAPIISIREKGFRQLDQGTIVLSFRGPQKWPIGGPQATLRCIGINNGSYVGLNIIKGIRLL